MKVPIGDFGGGGPRRFAPRGDHAWPAFSGTVSVFETGWSDGQKRLAALSTNSLLIRANNSNHMIQIDDPGVVVDAIRRVHVAACNKVRLARAFTTPEENPIEL